MDINRKLLSYMRGLYTYKRLVKIKGPEPIIKKAEERLTELSLDLTGVGFNVDAWIESDKGKVAFLQFCAESDHLDSIMEKCHECVDFGWFPSIGPYEEEHEYRCTIYKDVPMSCPRNVLCSKEESARRANEVYDRCLKCKHVETEDIEGLDFKDIGCTLKQNAYTCNLFKSK